MPRDETRASPTVTPLPTLITFALLLSLPINLALSRWGSPVWPNDGEGEARRDSVPNAH
jgi:hypothetical protein